jgi:hypothetical protein
MLRKEPRPRHLREGIWIATSFGGDNVGPVNSTVQADVRHGDAISPSRMSQLPTGYATALVRDDLVGPSGLPDPRSSLAVSMGAG